MIDEIKKRIEQVKNGKVPEGYQIHKSIGIAPIMWKCGELSDVLKNEQRPVPKPNKAYWRLGLRSHAKGTFHELIEDPETVAMDELFEVKQNDLIVNITFAWEHAIALADKDDEDKLVSHRFPTYVFKGSNCAKYYEGIVTQKKFKEMLGSISPGGAGRNRVMSKPYFLKLPCYIPPTVEQEKIAEILTHCDNVIELKKQLITEERKQKKWLADKFFKQSKLHTQALGELCIVTMGQSPDSKSYNSIQKGLPLIQGNADIENRISNPKSYTSEPTKTCEASDIILSVRAPVGTVAKSNMRACIGRGVCAITPKRDLEYIYQFLLYFEDKWAKISQGSTFDSVSGDEIRKIAVPISGEMNYVANILSTADRKIELLEQELEQWQLKKKALMQLLLTGIVRVNVLLNKKR